MPAARQDVRGAEALDRATEQLKGDVWVLFVGGQRGAGLLVRDEPGGGGRGGRGGEGGPGRLGHAHRLRRRGPGRVGGRRLRAKADLALRELPTLLDLNDPRQRLSAADAANRDRIRRLLGDE